MSFLIILSGKSTALTGTVYTRSLSSSLIVSQSITPKKIAFRSLSSSLIVSQSITSKKIASKLLISPLTFVQIVSPKKIAFRSLSSSLIVSQSIIPKKIAFRSLSSSLIVSQSITPKKIVSKSLSSSLSFVQFITPKGRYSKSLSSSLTFTQITFAGLGKFLHQSLTFTQSVSFKKIVSRSLTSSLIVSQSNLLKTTHNKKIVPVYTLFPNQLQPPQIHGRNKTKVNTDTNIILIQSISKKKISSKLISQSLVFVQNIIPLLKHFSNRSHTLLFTQSIITHFIRKKSLIQSLTFTQIISQKRSISKSLSSNISFVVIVSPFKRHLLNINHSLNITNILTKHLTHIQYVSQNIPFHDEAIKEWTKKPKNTLILVSTVSTKHIINRSLNQNLSLNQVLNKRFICKKSINQNLSFVQTILPIKVIKRSLTSNISFAQTATNNHISKFANTQNNLSFTQSLNKRSIYKRTISNFLIFDQSLNVKKKYNFHLDSLLILRQTTTNNNIQFIPVEDLTGSGGVDLKAEPKNCYEVSNQCHAEGFETIAGLSFPCSIINGQMAVIENYNNADFKQNCIIGLYNLSGGSDRTIELKTVASTISLINNSRDTLITFPYVITDHKQGYISLIADWASHSEGYKTIASGPASHSGGIGSIADLPTKFARSDNVDSQFGIITLSGLTKDAVLTPLLINNTPFKIRNNKTYSLFIHIAGRNIDGLEHAYFIRQGMIHNENGILSFVGSIVTVGSDINNPDWAISISADTVLKISVVGSNGKTIKWIARVDSLEL